MVNNEDVLFAQDTLEIYESYIQLSKERLESLKKQRDFFASLDAKWRDRYETLQSKEAFSRWHGVNANLSAAETSIMKETQNLYSYESALEKVRELYFNETGLSLTEKATKGIN